MVRYYNDSTTYRFLKKRRVADWLRTVAKAEGYTLGDVTYIFCSSAVHRQMNIDYIGHDYFTDVITFDYSDLKGEGYVTFSGEPDRRQKARVIGAVTLDRHSKNMDTWSGEVQFYCEPLKELLMPVNSTVSSSGQDVWNNGDVTCYPLITATASGTSMTIAAGGNSLTITGLTSSNTYKIDCAAGIVTNSAGTTNLTANSSGKFPVLNVGANSVTGSGWSSLTIDRRERYL